MLHSDGIPFGNTDLISGSARGLFSPERLAADDRHRTGPPPPPRATMEWPEELRGAEASTAIQVYTGVRAQEDLRY